MKAPNCFGSGGVSWKVPLMAAATILMVAVLFLYMQLPMLQLPDTSNLTNLEWLLGHKTAADTAAVPNADIEKATNGTGKRYAFATLLAGKFNVTEQPKDEDNGYFVSARLLAYQLMHNKDTCVDSSIDVIVFATPFVPQSQRDRLDRDGAKVLVVEPIMPEELPGERRWALSLTRFQLWKYTQYEKICFIDADTLVTGNLGDVFNDPATQLLDVGKNENETKSDEVGLPQSYLFAGKPEAGGWEHPYPPNESGYLNAGFFVAGPSREMFEYYVDLAKKSDRVDMGFMDQGVLNYAHRKEGNMPWQVLDSQWNINFARKKDYDGGCKSFHDKYWDGEGEEASADPFLKGLWQEQRKVMESYYEQRDAVQWRRFRA